MNYLGLSRDSFLLWCDTVKLNSCKYEFSNRTYFISGEFYAIADKAEIKKVKELHGDDWVKFYSKYDDVKPFLVEEKIVETQVEKYKAQSKEVADFIKNL